MSYKTDKLSVWQNISWADKKKWVSVKQKSKNLFNSNLLSFWLQNDFIHIIGKQGSVKIFKLRKTTPRLFFFQGKNSRRNWKLSFFIISKMSSNSQTMKKWCRNTRNNRSPPQLQNQPKPYISKTKFLYFQSEPCISQTKFLYFQPEPYISKTKFLYIQPTSCISKTKLIFLLYLPSGTWVLQAPQRVGQT